MGERDEAVQDAIGRMAAEMECPRCGHVGFKLSWVAPEHPSFEISGTTLGSGKVPRVRCEGCGVEVDGNRAR